MVKNNPTKNEEFVNRIQVLGGQWTKISCSVLRTHKCAQCELIVNSSQAKAAALQQTYIYIIYTVQFCILHTTLIYKYCPVWQLYTGCCCSLYTAVDSWQPCMMLFRKNMEKFVVCLTLPEQFDTLFHTSVNCEFLKHLNMPLLVQNQVRILLGNAEQ